MVWSAIAALGLVGAVGCGGSGGSGGGTGTIRETASPSAGVPQSLVEGACATYVEHSRRAGTHRITVRAQHLGCPTARRVIHDFWSDQVALHQHSGKNGYPIWYTMDPWPGWRCVSEGGAGVCKEHARRALYLVVQP
jgi:hypothetical protein